MDPILLISCIVAALACILLLPLKGARKYRIEASRERFHEEDAVLSRRLLEPGTENYLSYYEKYPGRKEDDDRARNSPGLLSAESKYHQPETFAAARANFQLIDHMAALIDAPEKVETREKQTVEKRSPAANTRFISQWLAKSGAHSSGFTVLQDHHLYSHKGRGPRAGEIIEKQHEFAIAITVEMDHEMMAAAPHGSAVMESSEQYLRSGILALKAAAYIRMMGYEARAHIDGNYEVICPLVAVDAGLGVIGRMGLLMTPRLGPRVRISVVTTNMPLQQSSVKPVFTTLHFCELCKKCAENCPAAAIPSGPRSDIGGVPRWQINSEKCYQLWTVAGTDCGRCMSVCPYSHKDNAFHRFIRWGIKNNLVFRHLAVKLDNVIYGRKPRIRPLPDWADSREKT